VTIAKPIEFIELSNVTYLRLYLPQFLTFYVEFIEMDNVTHQTLDLPQFTSTSKPGPHIRQA